MVDIDNSIVVFKCAKCGHEVIWLGNKDSFSSCEKCNNSISQEALESVYRHYRFFGKDNEIVQWEMNKVGIKDIR